MKNNRIMQSKWFLYATEFFAGVSVMAVELGASRLMAPYFSSSQIVWTIIIGTIMIAMAIGNIVGGRLADKNPDPARLFGRILLAAVWIAAIPFIGKYVIAGISFLLMSFVKTNFLIWASFLSCLLLFVFPLLILGTVTPSLAKYTVANLEHNGKIVGELGALNTIGSIIGTFLPTFVTIPTVGTSATFFIFAGVLALISLLYFLTTGQKRVKSVVSVILIVAFGLGGMTSGFAFWDSSILMEDESIYNYIQVKDNENSRILSTNVLFGVQSIQMKEQKLSKMFYDYSLSALLMSGKGNDSKVLVLGLGAGTFPSQCKYYFPDSQIEGVEIDKKIADLAYSHFGMPETVPTYVEDGRAFLTASDELYDVILADAYQDITIPFQMSTKEFFEETKKHLTPDGILITNMNMVSEKENSINDYLCDTVSTVYDNVYTVDVKNYTNQIAFASQNPEMIKFFAEGISKLSEGEFRDFMNDVSDNLKVYEAGDLLLTDDKAPVELLSMQALDSLIEGEIDAMRGTNPLDLLN